jgi:hypothetical protein
MSQETVHAMQNDIFCVRIKRHYGFVGMSFYLELSLHNFQRKTAIWLEHTKENQPGNHGMRKH